MAASIHIEHHQFSLPIITVVQADIESVMQALQQSSEFNARPNTADNSLNQQSQQDLQEQDTATQPCVLALQTDQITATFIAQLVERLYQIDLHPVAIQTDNPDFYDIARFTGLAIINNAAQQTDLFTPQLNDFNATLTTIHRGSVLAGEQLYAQNKDLVVLGSIAADAEVIADGSIYIGGSLKGRAYAGNSGSMNIDEVRIQAHDFAPELVCINGFYQLKDDIKPQFIGQAVSVKFENLMFTYQLC